MKTSDIAKKMKNGESKTFKDRAKALSLYFACRRACGVRATATLTIVGKSWRVTKKAKR